MIQYVFSPEFQFLPTVWLPFTFLSCADFYPSRTGDLRFENEDSVLHRFMVPESIIDSEPFSTGRTLDLGVGGDGVIGRRVSFLVGGRVLGEGVIGWN